MGKNPNIYDYKNKMAMSIIVRQNEKYFEIYTHIQPIKCI